MTKNYKYFPALRPSREFQPAGEDRKSCIAPFAPSDRPLLPGQTEPMYEEIGPWIVIPDFATCAEESAFLKDHEAMEAWYRLNAPDWQP